MPTSCAKSSAKPSIPNAERRGRNGRKNARPKALRAPRVRTAKKPKPNLPGGSAPRSRRVGGREYDPKLLANHGLHERTVPLARRGPEPGRRAEDLLAGAAGVEGALLGRQRLKGVFKHGGRFRYPRERAGNRPWAPRPPSRGRNVRLDGFPRFSGVLGADATARNAGAFPLSSLVGLGAGRDVFGGRVVLDESEQVRGRILLRAVQAQGDRAGDALGLEERGEGARSRGRDPLGDEHRDGGRGRFGMRRSAWGYGFPRSLIAVLARRGFLRNGYGGGLGLRFRCLPLGRRLLGFGRFHRRLGMRPRGQDCFRRDLR